ncbi:MAG: phage portal protein family protein [Candidatus Hodarchaeales archaeon]
MTLEEFTRELGIAREGVIGAYDTEENPDDLGPQTYIEMQRNDGEVQAIVRLLTLPIVSTPFHILPAENDRGERDFIETIFLSPPHLGGMTTPLPFIISDMTRAIFEGFRLYEKVARIIEEGKYKGKVGWKKLAPRDAQTIELKADRHGGFAGAHQTATFGSYSVDVNIPPEKCMLFTFQKEKHWLYGESILKTAFYHYDKKHKLYYISHKKAEIDTLGLKILKVNQTLTSAERKKAEEVVDTLGINSRITLPPGIELEIQRGGEKGFDPLPLIDHHNREMTKSALVQILDQIKYAYPYGKGTSASQYVDLAIQSIMKQMEATLNTYAIAPLIDWNFGTQSYPEIRFEKLADASQAFLREVFNQIMRTGEKLPDGFVNEVVTETAKALRLKWAMKEKVEKEKKPLLAFEKGKKKRADELNINAPRTPKVLKEKLLNLKYEPDLEAKCYKLGEKFTNGIYRKQKNLS